VTFTIDEVAIPTSTDAADAADFIATVDVRNIVEAEGYGTEELCLTAEELLPFWRDQQYEPKRLFVARVDGRVVARSVFETRPADDATMAWVGIHLLPEFRRRGIGTALADHVEAIAVADGRTELVVYTVSKDAPGERLEAPTGFGSVPLANPEVRFLLGRGYTLEQVERGSRLVLPAPLALQLEQALSIAGDDYRLRQWTDTTPAQWLDDLAVLYTRMSTDAPTAGLNEPEDLWTAQRVRDFEELAKDDPRTVIVSAIEHLPSGHLVGMTDISVPAERHRAAEQRDTIVLREHRGHRLGMVLKAANLLHLERVAPGHPSIITFNAEENRHMLDVNEAIGFLPIGYEGAWKKVL
jgi:GNAT superfamily N-acetyltransferase